MDVLEIVLRIVHIGSGVLWVGAAFFFFIFIEPTANELGPDGERFMTRVVAERRMPVYFIAVSALTVLAGLTLYWIRSGGLQAEWVTSPTGLALTIGGISALIAFVGGNAMIKPNVDKLTALGAEIKAGGGPPTEEQRQALVRIQHTLRRIGTVDVVLLAIAVVAMASARYLG